MITSTILLFLIFAGNLYLEAALKRYYSLELFVIGCSILFGFIIVAGEYFRGGWVWKLSTVYYGLAMANIALLFLVTRNFMAFILTLFIILIGFVRAISKLEFVPEEDKKPVETYDVPADNTVTPDTVDPIIVQTTETKKEPKKAKKTKKK